VTVVSTPVASRKRKQAGRKKGGSGGGAGGSYQTWWERAEVQRRQEEAARLGGSAAEADKRLLRQELQRAVQLQGAQALRLTGCTALDAPPAAAAQLAPHKGRSARPRTAKASPLAAAGGGLPRKTPQRRAATAAVRPHSAATRPRLSRGRSLGGRWRALASGAPHPKAAGATSHTPMTMRAVASAVAGER
jgi:hypothetical protein